MDTVRAVGRREENEKQAERERERMESSPFSALAGLDLTDGGDEDDAPSGPTE